MKTKYLLPNKFKTTGWILLLIGLMFGTWFLFFDEVADIKVWMPALHNEFPMSDESGLFRFVFTSIIDEIAGTFIIVGALFVAFSREKQEDEYIMKIRLESLVWAVLVNSALMLFCLFAFYNFSFLTSLIFNLVTVQLLFVVKFKYELRKAVKYEE